jgi:Serine carboxypeptidase
MTVSGLQHGEVREDGNFSFVRIFDAGHFIPIDKPDVALELFRRAIQGLDIATGVDLIGEDIPVPFPQDEPITREKRA